MCGDDPLTTFARAQEGMTALMWAAASRVGGAGCVRLLLDAGADKNVTCNRVRVRSAVSAVGGHVCLLCFGLVD